MNTYFKKLLDPRWQKKRLEILNRDEFSCKYCNNTEKTLHIHHIRYGKEPWDVPNKYLITLCEDCHNAETILDLKIKEEVELFKYFYGSEKLIEYLTEFTLFK